MKTTITAFAIAAIFAACNSRSNTSADTRPLTNENQELYKHDALTDKPQAIEMNGVNEDADQHVQSDKQTVVKYVYVTSPKASPAKTAAKKTPAKSTTTSSNSSSSSNGSVAQTPVPAKKKGWSKAAKGAVIGGGSGAVIGAVISKKRGKGAIIGGILGAAGGYVIGRTKDKKDGRY